MRTAALISLPEWCDANKEARMNTSTVIGLDIGKTELVAARGNGVGQTVANAPAGHARLVRWVQQQQGALVVLEATGRYHWGIWDALTAAGIPVAVSNPRQVHHWIQSQGQRAKTDRLDAQLLARYGTQCQPKPTTPPTHIQRTIAALVDRRQQLVKDQTRLGHQLAEADPIVADDIKGQLAEVSARLQGIDVRIAEQTAADAPTQQRVAQLVTAPGIAQTTAARLVAELPELGQLTGKQLAALVGVAPFDQQSGRWRGQSRIGGGRASLRHALYVPTMTAIRCDPTIRAFYDRLRVRGKSVKQARIACLRKLLGILNAMVRDGLTWQQTRTGQGTFLLKSA
jgi:transposase